MKEVAGQAAEVLDGAVRGGSRLALGVEVPAVEHRDAVAGVAHGLAR
jgi:hypothetical protein